MDKVALKKAIFLDRDGTLNPDPGYISNPDDFNLFPGVGESLKKLKDAGYLLILITNQSGIARGLISTEQLNSIHRKLSIILNKYEVKLDAIYYCPHHPDFPDSKGIAECNCRKPKPGLILKALADWNIDVESSYMLGDKLSDINTGINSGIKPVFIGNSLPEGIKNIPCFKTFPEAANWVLSI